MNIFHRCAQKLLWSLIAMIIMQGMISGPAAALEQSRKWAVVIGIDDYLKEVTPLRCATKDAREFKKTLLNSCGFSEENTFLLTSDQKGSRMPDKASIVRWISYIRQNASAGDTFVFFFSGHGMDMNRESYLLTIEADPFSQETLDASALRVSDLRKYVEDLGVSKKLLFIDACRNDPRTGKGERDNVFTDGFSKSLTIKSHGGASADGEFSATFFSCKVGQRSFEWSEKSMGFFTYYIVQGISGAAHDDKGRVTINALQDYLERNVSSSVQKERGAEQRPWMMTEGSLAGNWVLAAHDIAAAPPDALGTGKAATESTARLADMLSQMAQRPNTEQAKRLIDADPKIINDKGSSGYTPLHWAAFLGNKPMAELFLSRGADLTVLEDKGGFTPLQKAICGNHKEMVAFLLEKGADVNGRNALGETPLFRAASEGKKDIFELLVSHGADPTLRDKKGSSPIHAAAVGGYRDIVELLLTRGVKVDELNRSGETPLFRAVWSGDSEIVKFLISRGAMVNVKNANGETPLHKASALGFNDLVEIFIAHGADVNAKDKENNTPLKLAMKERKIDTAEILRKHGARE
jgi:ankyrin repeat protein